MVLLYLGPLYQSKDFVPHPVWKEAQCNKAVPLSKKLAETRIKIKNEINMSKITIWWENSNDRNMMM